MLIINKGIILKNKLIFISSDEPFSPVWHTQIQYANVLSEFNKVIYINPPSQWKFSSLFDFEKQIDSVKENFILYQYKNFLPVGLGVFATKINDFINSKILYSTFIKESYSPKDIIVWQFDPFRFIKPTFKYWKSIYHVIDPFFKRKFDKILASNSNLVIVTSPKFEAMYQQLNANVLHIPQAFMKREDKYSENLRIPVNSNYFVIIGTFSDFIDYELLLKIVAQDINILAIGPLKITSESKMKQWESLLNLDRFEYIGVVHFSDLNFYISKSMGGLICYEFISKGLELDKNSSPLKAINYLANNKLIVSTVDVEIPALENVAVFKEENHEVFINYLKKISNNELLIPVKKIENHLSSITYEKFIEKISLNL